MASVTGLLICTPNSHFVVHPSSHPTLQFRFPRVELPINSRNSAISCKVRFNGRSFSPKLRAVAEDEDGATLVSEEAASLPPTTEDEAYDQTFSVALPPSDVLTMLFQPEGTTIPDSAIPAVSTAFKEVEGCMDLRVQVQEVASVELTKQIMLQATGVASNLVEIIQGSRFKSQTLSLNSSMHFPKQQQSVAVIAPNFGSRLGYPTVIRCNLNRRICNLVRFKSEYSKNRANYEGSWEEPDDGSDDSEYESDFEDEDETTEEKDLDYESDWEANGSVKTVGDVNALSTKEYEEDLVRDVEEMLSPEELAILKQNEAPNLDKLSTVKWKPLHTFALSGQIKFMDGMLEKDYDINLVNKDGSTALHLAVIGKREAVISHLLRKGANPEAKDRDGATPLHYAAQVGALQTVKLLIKHKVDVNAVDNDGWTPLHVAMQTRNRDTVKILLVNGADKTRRNEDGKTPLDLALCYGKEFKSYDLAKLVKQVSARDF